MPPTDRRRREERDEPVSMAPLDPEVALRALLAVNPEGRTAEESTTTQEKSSE